MQKREQLQRWRLLSGLAVCIVAASGIVMLSSRVVGDAPPQARAIALAKTINGAEFMYQSQSGHFGTLDELRMCLDFPDLQQKVAAAGEYYSADVQLTRDGYAVTVASKDKRRASYVSSQSGGVQAITAGTLK